ncbi:MAG: response regulator [Lachnospiraceae bacterium]
MMYTVLVADDEEEIRRALVQKVDWEKHGFHVIGDAENGIEALEQIELLQPDVLFTDIRMPFINGIELARQAREIRPTMQIVFLSGYDDFSYAQQAIQYNILSYLLKPISSKELETELDKLKEIIDKKFEAFAEQSISRNRLEKSTFLIPLLLDRFNNSSHDKLEEQMLQNAVSCGFLDNSDNINMQYMVIVFMMRNADGDNMTQPSHVSAVDMIVQKYLNSASFYINDRIVTLVSGTKAKLNKYVHILVEEVAQSAERIMEQICYIGVSNMVSSLLRCNECYVEAMNALSYSQRKESNVHFITDEERVLNYRHEEMETTIGNLEKLLRGGSMSEFKDYLETLFHDMNSGKYAPYISNFLITEIVSSVLKVLYTVMDEASIYEFQKEFSLETFSTFGYLSSKTQQCMELCLAAKKKISEQRKKSSETICDKAIAVIQERYADETLSLVSVSEEISVSPNYLSSLIKKSTGQSFIDLLTAKRIEKAKELLMCTNMKIRDITEKCGYKDQHYFSYCFKKATGMSPNVCRRMYEDKHEETV